MRRTLLLAGCAVYGHASVAPGTRDIKQSSNPLNPLPAFTFQGKGGESIRHVLQYQHGPVSGSYTEAAGLATPDDILVDGMEIKSRWLPYRLRDLYRSERKPTTINTVDLVDGDFKAQVTPQWGGRVFSFTHTPTGTDLIHAETVHQPVTAGVRNAMVDGGIEWNYSPSVLGHWVGTLDDIWAARVKTSRGDVVRVYEFDRFNNTAFQVDMILLNGTLWAHPKTINPSNVEVRQYWWTNVAQAMTAPSTFCKPSEGNPGARIIAPAVGTFTTGSAIHLDRSEVGWPKYNAFCCEDAGGAYQQGRELGQSHLASDMSYLDHHLRGADVFFRITKPQRPYVAIADRDIYKTRTGVYHGHPLNGTKFFVGGIGRDSQRWFHEKDAPDSPNKLAPGEGTGGGCGTCSCFTELQTGVTPTQIQDYGAPPHSSKQWTEFWRDMSAVRDGSNALYSDDYSDVLKRVDEWIEGPEGVPKAHFDEMDAFLEGVAKQPVDEILHEGQPYGALHEMLTGSRMAASMKFSLPERTADEVAPWLELARDGTFSDASLARSIPLSFMVDQLWMDKLSASSASHGATWLHDLHLGIGAAERRHIDDAVNLFESSVSKRPTAIGHRNLAVTYTDKEARTTHYKAAWELAVAGGHTPTASAPADPSSELLQYALAAEMSSYLVWVAQNATSADEAQALWADVDAFIGNLSSVAGCKTRGRYCDSDQVAWAARDAAMYHEDWELAMDLTENWPYVSITLQQSTWAGTGTWEKVVVGLAEKAAGRKLGLIERRHAMRARPPPIWMQPPGF